MVHGRTPAVLTAVAFVQLVSAIRDSISLEEKAKHSYKSFNFEPPTLDEMRLLDNWDDWWGPDFLNGVLAPMCGVAKNFKTCGMQDIYKNDEDEWRPNQEPTVLKSLAAFETEVDPKDAEGMEELRSDLCDPKELDQDEDEALDGQASPGLDCQLVYPRKNFGQSPSSDSVMACRVVSQDAEATAEGLLEKAKVENFPDGWWQNEKMQGDWKRWFIAGYAPLKELQGMMFDGSEGDIALMSALFMLPYPGLKLNKKISPRGTNAPPPSYAQSDIDAVTEQVKGPIRIQYYEHIPEQPTSFLSFDHYLAQGQKALEFKSIYQPRRGSLQHAAALNRQEDIVLIFTMPLALKEDGGTPFCQDGWENVASHGVTETVEVLQNLLRPLFPTNCQYYDAIVARNFRDWYSDFSEPRRHAFLAAWGVDGDQTPSAELAAQWDQLTCPCVKELPSCKFANFFEGECATKKASGKTKERKNWKGEWAGIWVDQRDEYKDCKHIIKKVKGKWKISFRTGKNSKPSLKSCTGAKSYNTAHLDLAEPGPINELEMPDPENDGDSTIALDIVRLKKTEDKKLKYSFWIKIDGGKRVWLRDKKGR